MVAWQSISVFIFFYPSFIYKQVRSAICSRTTETSSIVPYPALMQKQKLEYSDEKTRVFFHENINKGFIIPTVLFSKYPVY